MAAVRRHLIDLLTPAEVDALGALTHRVVDHLAGTERPAAADRQATDRPAATDRRASHRRGTGRPRPGSLTWTPASSTGCAARSAASRWPRRRRHRPALRCPRRHSFDIARQGYVDLRAGRAPHAGDTAEMVAARADFLAAGHYD